jgi:hypothetical protein
MHLAVRRAERAKIVDLYHHFLTQTGRNMIKCAHYFPIYERHFARFRGQPMTMFEIGTGEGGPCRMWKSYFGPFARIVSIDIADKAEFAESQIFIRTGDQGDAQFLNGLLAEFGPPDIVLDDGSHMMEHINTSFDVLFPRMRSGVYLAEDLDGCYYAERGGALYSPASFIERAKHLCDEVNIRHTRGELKPTPSSRGLFSVSVYDAVVVLEKAAFINREMIRKPVPLPKR